MLLFQVKRIHLLFPGDAQWGTWRVNLEDPDRVELLRRTVFYKVGHHGSHNATPRAFVEKVLGDDFWAMTSTRQRGSWPIPKPELMAELAKRTTKLVRSDTSKPTPRGFRVSAEGYIEATISL